MNIRRYLAGVVTAGALLAPIVVNTGQSTSLATEGTTRVVTHPQLARLHIERLGPAPKIITRGFRRATVGPALKTHAVTNDTAAPNWSGYSAYGYPQGTIQGVFAEWREPAVTVAYQNLASSSWVGVDGFNQPSLFQDGTESDNNPNGSAYYGAWTEDLPAQQQEHPVEYSNGTPAPVVPGDLMAAWVVATSTAGMWNMNLEDLTQKWYLNDYSEFYAGPGTDADWIEEAPAHTSADGQTQDQDIADFHSVTFTNMEIASAGNWYYMGFNNRDWSIDSINKAGQYLAEPGNPLNGGSAFTDYYEEGKT